MSRQAPLSEFIARCDPSALPPEDTYVPRNPDFASRLAIELTPSAKARVLLFGQTGVGKSTELTHLGRLLQERYLVIQPPVDKVLDLQEVSWHELLIYSALWAAEHLPDAWVFGCLPENTYRLDIVTKRQDELSEALGIEQPSDKPSSGPPPPTALQRFRNEPRHARPLIARGPAQFWDLASSLLSSISAAADKPAVLIWDGLERMPLDSARDLFLDARNSAGELPCRAVITAPLALSFESYFGDIEERFRLVERLRALPCDPGTPGYDFLFRMAEVRGASQVFPLELIKEAIRLSSGLPRQFLQLLSNAATQALVDGQEQVPLESFARAVQRVTERWQYQLEPGDYEALELNDTERPSHIRSRLLRIGALVEHDLPAGGLRIVINPLVEALLRRRRQEAENASA
jgi:energy-coupling factor transporter ATP-binding protein EcfA2